MEFFDGYNNLNTDFLWNPRVNQTFYGRRNDLNPKFNSPMIAIIASTTNLNPSNVAGYLTQLSDTQIGLAEIGERYTLPNKVLKVVILPSLINYRFRFTLATPVGNCKIQIWESILKN